MDGVGDQPFGHTVSVLPSNLPVLNSIYRFLSQHQLHTKARRRQLRQLPGGATKCFEAPYVNDLWMTDFSPVPYLQPTQGAKAIPTFQGHAEGDMGAMVGAAFVSSYRRPNHQVAYQLSRAV